MPTATANPQMQLPLRESPAPRVGLGEVRLLCDVLRGAGWMTAAQIVRRAAGFALAEHWTDRHIRAIAEASEGAVLSWPGSPGYKLFDDVSEKEYAHCDAAWASQIERMTARRAHYQLRHHKQQLVNNPAEHSPL